MDFYDKPYVIGIDLGTTNSAVSYADTRQLKDESGAINSSIEKRDIIKVFSLPQLTGQGEFTKSEILPSFLYIPGEYDISKESLKHPWKKTEDWFVGTFARDHGSKVPSRLVSSAKSWLCHAGADREAKILPWGSEGFDKISPVTATAQYLKHIKSAWNHSVKDEDLFLENQMVVITVPASFNETARELTLQAAREAGMGASVILLEEPLAAFYSWFINHENTWQQKVGPNDLILVCDVGGGTTDFSLITLKTSDGSPRFERVAVGDHLILGGDNIDLELAKIVESKFKGKVHLTSDKWKTLCHRCREAKERLLEKGESAVRITLKGEGRSLISGTLAADLTYDDLEKVLMDDFFSEVSIEKKDKQHPGQEMADFGLPFEKESSITSHIVTFLEHHRRDVQQRLGKNDPIPDYILFNGGTLKSSLVQERIRDCICRWYHLGSADTPGILENNIPYLAVGVGASYYGLVKQGAGVKVGSGSPRGYYLGVSMENDSLPKAICFVERGLDEGSVIKLPKYEFKVRANQPVGFDVYSSSYRSGDTAGEIVEIDDTLTPMPPIHTIINFGKQNERKTIPVTIEAQYTELGTLSMRCISAISDHKWTLQFQLRDTLSNAIEVQTDVIDERILEKALDLVQTSFQDENNDTALLAGIVKKLESIVEKPKSKWPLGFLRAMADKLLQMKDSRTLSVTHEARWLNLVGFCMRPGFGDAFDENRMKIIWKIYLAGSGFEKSIQNRLEWWIFLRRIAGGMKAGQQRQFYQNVSSMIMPRKNEKIKTPPQEFSEIWMTMANMEKLLVKDKIILAKYLLNHSASGKIIKGFFWIMSRLGARNLLYGSVDRVVPSREVYGWIKKIMKMDGDKSDIAVVESAVAQMARKTGDRTRDIDPDERDAIIQWLKSRNAARHLIHMMNEKIVIQAEDKSLQFGESLPSGLVLRDIE